MTYTKALSILNLSQELDLDEVKEFASQILEDMRYEDAALEDNSPYRNCQKCYEACEYILRF